MRQGGGCGRRGGTAKGFWPRGGSVLEVLNKAHGHWQWSAGGALGRGVAMVAYGRRSRWRRVLAGGLGAVRPRRATKDGQHTALGQGVRQAVDETTSLRRYCTSGRPARALHLGTV